MTVHDAMEKYIWESLAAGIIQPSLYPYRVCFFFAVKDKTNLPMCWLLGV